MVMSVLPIELRIISSTATFEAELIVRHSENVSDTAARHSTITSVRNGFIVILRNMSFMKICISPHPNSFIIRHKHLITVRDVVHFIEFVNA